MNKFVQPQRTQGSQRSFEDRANIMDNLHATIANRLSERYSYLADRVRELAAPLSEEQLWQKPFPFGNSFGHLVLHLTGNLNYYIGAEVAEVRVNEARPVLLLRFETSVNPARGVAAEAICRSAGL